MVFGKVKRGILSERLSALTRYRKERIYKVIGSIVMVATNREQNLHTVAGRGLTNQRMQLGTILRSSTR